MSTVNWKIFELKIFHKQKFGVKKCSYTDRLGKFVTRWQKGDVTWTCSSGIRPRVRDLYSMEEFGRDCCTRGYPVYKELLEKCSVFHNSRWRSTCCGCERSISCGCEKDGNNRWTFTTKVVKTVFVLFATRGHDILYSDWGRRYSVDLYISLNLLFMYCAQSARVIFVS